MLRGQELWCQLFSEPEAGRDLSGLQTRATATEGGWLLTGQKVWSTYGHIADWGICLARTDPDASPHRGISYFLLDMNQPGIDARPLRQMTGESEFSEVFLDNAFVPSNQLVGPENAGWQVAKATLKFERGGNPRQMVQHIAILDKLISLASSLPRDVSGGFDERLAQAIEAVAIFRVHVLSRPRRHQPRSGSYSKPICGEVVLDRTDPTTARHRDANAGPIRALVGFH